MTQVGYINFEGSILPLLCFSQRELLYDIKTDEDGNPIESVLGARTTELSVQFILDVPPKDLGSVNTKGYYLEEDTLMYCLRDKDWDTSREIVCNNNEMDIHVFQEDDLNPGPDEDDEGFPRLVKQSTMKNVEQVFGLID